MNRLEGNRLACCAFLLLFMAGTAAASVPASPDPEQLLKQAESIPSSSRAEFTRLMERLAAHGMNLSPQQRMHQRYLMARQTAFAGNYDAAMPPLTAIAGQTTYPVLAFRASATMIDLLVTQSRYGEAFVRLNPLLEQLPQMTKADVRIQGLGVAAQLYNEAGQYDASTRYADQIIRESADAKNACRGWFYKSTAQFEQGIERMTADQLSEGTKACEQAGDTLFASGFQYVLASFELRAGQYDSAIGLLRASYPRVLRAGFPPQVSEFESTLAKAYLGQGDLAAAAKFARRALATNANRQYSESTARAYHVLYEVDKKAGDGKAALDHLEKFVVTNDGYLSRLSAKALAYRIVEQKVLARKLQFEELDKKNKLLGLQGELDRKELETGRLYILLLLLGLAFIGLWGYRIKRSQLRFMRLARRDGLTGIFNRQHFVGEAERLLHYCQKSGRDACMVLLDLDHFKQVNDTHGHAVGDQVLKRTVVACQAHLRSTDLFGRLGGEEFGILLPECDLDRVLARVDEMRLAIAAISTGKNDPTVTVSASFGVASTAQSGYKLRDLMTGADDALYKAKREGRNRISMSLDRRDAQNAV